MTDERLTFKTFKEALAFCRREPERAKCATIAMVSQNEFALYLHALRKPDVATVDNDIQHAVRVQLDNARDNLHRAQAAAEHYNPSQRWGESGETLQQIIDDYQAQVHRWEHALARVLE